LVADFTYPAAAMRKAEILIQFGLPHVDVFHGDVL